MKNWLKKGCKIQRYFDGMTGKKMKKINKKKGVTLSDDLARFRFEKKRIYYNFLLVQLLALR